MANIPPDHRRISASRFLAMKTISFVAFLLLARCIWIVTVVVVALASSARATTIDLNDFFAVPPQNVTIAPDGSFAELQLGTVGLAALVHDPSFLGSPALIIPTAQESWLKFDYDFVEGPNNNDEFSAGVTDSLGESLGPAFVFSTTDSSSGTVEFNLTQFVGEPFVGLAFILEALDAGLGSTVKISDLRLQSIPEPSTVGMFALGASGLGLTYWRRKRRAGV